MSKSFQDSENAKQFEARKQSHLKLAMDQKNEATGGSGLENIELIHEALPELNFNEVTIQSKIFNKPIATPFLISSMTAGHEAGQGLNLMLARQAAERGWVFAVGSQRRELTDPELVNEWVSIRKQAPGFIALGNIGLSQLIHTKKDELLKLVEGLQAEALIVHLNALQEALQLEGTPQFKGGFTAISELCKNFPVPIIVKETGCGFSSKTLNRLKETGVSAVDIGGFGGTHWGRIEGARAEQVRGRGANIKAEAAKSFSAWGISTLQSLLNAVELKPSYEIWASGGIRSGLDAAKAFALGADRVGFAKPILEAAMKDESTLSLEMQRFEFELKTALFCTGCKDINSAQNNKVWEWK